MKEQEHASKALWLLTKAISALIVGAACLIISGMMITSGTANGITFIFAVIGTVLFATSAVLGNNSGRHFSEAERLRWERIAERERRRHSTLKVGHN